jgi:hypothetical protein
MQLVMQNQQIAMMLLGKVANPVTNKSEVNLEHAKYTIDMLDMLLIKTNGNLSEYESKFLNEVIRELKLNYVELLDKNPNTA